MSAVFDVARQGRPGAVVARARLELLFDPGTFRPVRTAVGDGVLSGSGRVNGRPVHAWAQDGGFKGGSLGEAGGQTMHSKNGVARLVAEGDVQAAEMVRAARAPLPSKAGGALPLSPPEEP